MVGIVLKEVLISALLGGVTSGAMTFFKIKRDNMNYEKCFNKYMEKKEKQTETNNKEA